MYVWMCVWSRRGEGRNGGRTRTAAIVCCFGSGLWSLDLVPLALGWHRWLLGFIERIVGPLSCLCLLRSRTTLVLHLVLVVSLELVALRTIALLRGLCLFLVAFLGMLTVMERQRKEKSHDDCRDMRRQRVVNERRVGRPSEREASARLLTRYHDEGRPLYCPAGSRSPVLW